MRNSWENEADEKWIPQMDDAVEQGFPRVNDAIEQGSPQVHARVAPGFNLYPMVVEKGLPKSIYY